MNTTYLFLNGTPYIFLQNRIPYNFSFPTVYTFIYFGLFLMKILKNLKLTRRKILINYRRKSNIDQARAIYIPVPSHLAVKPK